MDILAPVGIGMATPRLGELSLPPPLSDPFFKTPDELLVRKRQSYLRLLQSGYGSFMHLAISTGKILRSLYPYQLRKK